VRRQPDADVPRHGHAKSRFSPAGENQVDILAEDRGVARARRPEVMTAITGLSRDWAATSGSHVKTGLSERALGLKARVDP
jgi:hypothetical protein